MITLLSGKKNFKTPKKYPRRNGMPKKEPIIKKK